MNFFFKKIAALCAGQLVSVDNILVHLKELDEIARIDGLNSRSVKNNYNGKFIILFYYYFIFELF